MKKLNLFVVLGMLLVFSATKAIQGEGIQGKILPADAASTVLAISGKDTLITQVNQGDFKFPGIKLGTYTILIKGMSPHRDTSIVNVAVVKGATTDVGLIKLF